MIFVEKFTPFDKMSKKKQRELNQRKRKTWGNINPITRTSKNLKVYDRRKAQKWSDDFKSEPYIYN